LKVAASIWFSEWTEPTTSWHKPLRTSDRVTQAAPQEVTSECFERALKVSKHTSWTLDQRFPSQSSDLRRPRALAQRE